MKTKIRKIIDAHRNKSVVCCDEDCLCWDFDNLLIESEWEETKKLKRWQVFILAFLIGTALGYAWHYKAVGNTISFQCPPEKPMIATVLYDDGIKSIVEITCKGTPEDGE